VATVDFRVFAQSSDQDLLRMTNPYGFFRLSMVTFLEGVPVRSISAFNGGMANTPRVHHWAIICAKLKGSHTMSIG
jgi:hypothetical protein